MERKSRLSVDGLLQKGLILSVPLQPFVACTVSEDMHGVVELVKNCNELHEGGYRVPQRAFERIMEGEQLRAIDCSEMQNASVNVMVQKRQFFKVEERLGVDGRREGSALDLFHLHP